MRENIFVQQELYEKQFLIATPKRKLADSIKIFRIHTFCDPELHILVCLLKQHLSMGLRQHEQRYSLQYSLQTKQKIKPALWQMQFIPPRVEINC